MRLYIGLDIGTSFGWAVLDNDGERVSYGTWDLSGTRHEGGGMRELRLRRLLRDLIAETQGIGEIVAVGYELVRRRARVSGIETGHVYGELRGVVKAMCAELSVPFGSTEVGTMKKLATGKGNADKAAMMKAAKTRWSLAEAGEDEADALWAADVIRLEVRL